MSITDIDRAQYGPMTFATPEPEHPYGDIFATAERSARLTGNMVSESAAREEAYDRRIEAARQVSGVTLENPERGGYSIDARKAIRQEVISGGMSPIDEQGGIPAYQKRVFDQKMAELQAKHPDLEFGGLDEEARALATQSAQDVSRATSQPDLNPILKYGAEFAGGAWGSRRDPLFLGSLFAGPTSAVGRTALARVASSALNQGLFNAGLTALEQPAVQAWHAKIGQETGAMPAVQDIGMAFALGMIPGAAVEGLKEAAAPLRRLLAGRPEAGDVAKAGTVLGPVEPSAAATMRAGEDSLAADQAALTGPAPKDVAPDLHDDLVGAALKRADDPAAPSPEAVAAAQPITAYHGSPYSFDAFDIGKIGEGEGAQAFGHGLYFAENQEVAEGYRKQLTPSESYLHLHEGDKTAALAALDQQLSEGGWQPEARATAEQMRRDIESGYKGTTYQVRIHADRDMLLDWDRPLSEQSEGIRNAFENHPDPSVAGTAAKHGQVSGEAIYQRLVSRAEGGPAEVAKLLHDAGIPGIKYLDQGSRGLIDNPDVAERNGQWFVRENGRIKPSSPAFDTKDAAQAWIDKVSAGQSRNFVIFDHNDVEITHKNGEPVRNVSPELQSRIERANPKNAQEAAAAADEALDDFGRRDGMSALREAVDRGRADEAEAIKVPGGATEIPGGYRLPINDNEGKKIGRIDIDLRSPTGQRQVIQVVGAEVNASDRGKGYGIKAYQQLADFALGQGKELWSDRSLSPEAARIYEALRKRGYEVIEQNPNATPFHAQFKIVAGPEKLARDDPMGKIPFINEDGTVKMLSARSAAALGERETTAAMLVRSCK